MPVFVIPLIQFYIRFRLLKTSGKQVGIYIKQMVIYIYTCNIKFNNLNSPFLVRYSKTSKKNLFNIHIEVKYSL